jgi:hypothetical protein
MFEHAVNREFQPSADESLTLTSSQLSNHRLTPEEAHVRAYLYLAVTKNRTFSFSWTDVYPYCDEIGLSIAALNLGATAPPRATTLLTWGIFSPEAEKKLGELAELRLTGIDVESWMTDVCRAHYARTVHGLEWNEVMPLTLCGDTSLERLKQSLDLINE